MNLYEDFRFYMLMARRRLVFFLAPLIAIGIGGTAVVFYLPAIYTSSAKILVETQQIPDTFVKSTVTALATERLLGIQQRVLTRDNMLEIADKFSLFKDLHGYSRTDIYELMKQRITFEMIDLAPPNQTRRRDGPVTVAFNLGFDYEHPEVAAAVANELVGIVLNEDIQDRTLRASETTSFLAKESERLAAALKTIDAQIADFKLRNSATLPEKLAFSMGQLEQQQNLVTETERDIRAAEEGRRMLQFEANVRRNQPSMTGASPGRTPEQTLRDLKTQYEKQSVVYSEDHPEMRALKKQIAAQEKVAGDAASQFQNASQTAVGAGGPASLEEQLIGEKIAEADRRVELLKVQRDSMAVNNRALEQIVLRTPQVGAELSALERRREALQTSSDEMAAKLSQAQLGERLELGQQAERFQVIEAPIVPQSPTRPKRIPLLFLVAGASLGGGLAAAVGAEFLNGTIKRSSDLSRNLNQRVLVVVPYIFTKEERRRRPVRAIVYLLLLLALLAIGLAALHIFYMPLDVLMYTLLRKFDRLL